MSVSWTYPCLTLAVVVVLLAHGACPERLLRRPARQQPFFQRQQQQQFGQQQFRQPQQQQFGEQQFRQPQQQQFGRQQQFGDQQFQQLLDQPLAQGSSFNCPERNGYFPNSRQCDAYYKCENGVAKEELCPEGLLFNDKNSPFAYPCSYPNEVQCLGRSAVQPAQPTEECPHQYGYYALGDAANCGQFKNCAAGRGFVFDCPDGLAFNQQTLHCDWPDLVETCNPEAYLGFTCPEEPRLFGQVRTEPRVFRSNTDCQIYFVCVNGRPRRYNCGEGRAFDEQRGECDAAENVTGCASAAPVQNGFNQFNPTRLF